VGQNKAWQVGVSSSTSRSLTCTYISLFVLPFRTSLTDSRIARTDRPEPSPSRSQACAPRFHMHPLLLYTRLHHTPISYNVAFTPSAQTVVDRTVHSPLPAITLAQPTTELLILASSHLPITQCTHPFQPSPSHSPRRNHRYWQARTSRSAATCATTTVCGRQVPRLTVCISTIGRRWNGGGCNAADHHIWLIHVSEMYCN
jgi:hypothetical protein